MSDTARSEVARVIHDLLAGRMSREEASRWAEKRQGTDARDELIEEALDLLTGIDSLQVGHDGRVTGYLFDFQDLETLLSRL